MTDLLNTVPGGILVFNDDGMITFVNDTLKDWLGYGDHELEGKHIETILSRASRIFYQTHFFPLVMLHSRAEEIFLTLTGKNNEEVPALVNSVRRSEAGLFRNVCVFMPVLQRKKYEAEILEAKRTAEKAQKENTELGELTAKLELKTQELDKQYQRMLAINQDILQFNKLISHDLQEPIRKIKLFASIFSSGRTDQLSQRQHSAIGKITASAQRLHQLTLGLQQYVAVDTEKTDTTVDLNESVNAALEKVRERRDFSSFQVVRDKLPAIQGYPVQLELLFYHLFDNAVRFRKPDEDLVIRISHTLFEENMYRALPDKYKFVEHVRIIVSDNGIGLDMQYQDYVFQLVKKIDSSSEGLGIGLSLVKKIVDNHSGTIRVESTPGSGTNVILVLPLSMR
jgi:sigma-B regulation protein RsbU (phosphoserine phosphatase)